MTDSAQRSLAESVRRWETPFERDRISLEKLAYDATCDRLTLELSRHSDDRRFRLDFENTIDFRVMDEIGWASAGLHPQRSALYDPPLSRDHPVATCMLSASAVKSGAWPELVFVSKGAPDWIYVIFTGWDCVEIVASAPPEISWDDSSEPV